MQDDLLLTIFVVSPLLLGYALLRFFRKYRQHRKTSRPSLWLIVGNVLVFLFLCSVVVLGGEIRYRFFHDSTDSFGLTKSTQKWFDRHFRWNQWDVRDSMEYELRRSPGKRRVSFLGDSFAAGHGVANVEDRFANRIRVLRPNYEVHLLARCGWDTGAELGVFRYCVQSGYQTDVLVLVYCLNDIADLVPEWQSILDRIHKSSEGGFLREHSYLFSMLYYRWKAAHDPDVSNYYEFVADAYEGPIWEQQQKRLRLLRDEVESHNGRLLVVTFPFLHVLGDHYEYRHIHERLNAFWNKLNVPHLDLLGVFESHTADELVVNAYDAHPNEFAHALAAQAIVAFLDEQLASQQARGSSTPP